jgi:hypothetical protein
MPGGFMILKINEIKKKEKNQNIESELKRIINLKKTNQLKQFSKVYFNKVKKNIKIHEFKPILIVAGEPNSIFFEIFLKQSKIINFEVQ